MATQYLNTVSDNLSQILLILLLYKLILVFWTHQPGVLALVLNPRSDGCDILQFFFLRDHIETPLDSY